MSKQTRNTGIKRDTLPGLRLVSVNNHPARDTRKRHGLTPVGAIVWCVVNGLRH